MQRTDGTQNEPENGRRECARVLWRGGCAGAGAGGGEAAHQTRPGGQVRGRDVNETMRYGRVRREVAHETGGLR